eukprot:scaffold2563_cov124-Cylindrotheca_fusiformis.AAC.22
MVQNNSRNVEDQGIEEDENQNCTLIVVIVSLLLVAVLAGALVGGVVSGDPSNGFFVTIIASSSVIIIFAAVLSIRGWCKSRRGSDGYLNEAKGTFSCDEDEDDINRRKEMKSYGRDPSIKEFDAVRGGDVSVLSPNTHDVESCMNDGESGITSFAGRILLNKSRQRRGFDFANVVTNQQARGREDPPDASERVPAIVPKKWEPLQRDPSAVRFTVKERISTIEEDNDANVGSKTPFPKFAKKKNEISKDSEDEETGNLQNTKSPKAPSTPASVASSVASSIFRGFFGSKKKEASTPVASNGKNKAGRPPMPGSNKAKTEAKQLETIGGNLTSLNLPSTPGKKAPASPGKSSVFSIPAPRRVPSSPGARSAAASSVVSDGVASSTFDPAAHERALSKMRRNTASLGATGNDMPLYYEDGEEDSVQSGVYDVFAPPGPIGVVVDTTENGCVVHSLRKTSSMQGLMNPGDLIIALDDVDVQSLDASELTKLMAQKSQQTERKFTLIAANP